MKKRIVSLLFIFVMLITSISAMGISASAEKGVESGVVQDTSKPGSGVVNWSFAYNTDTGTATLTLSGNGYMPNGIYEESWFPIQQEVQCYVTKVVIKDGVKSVMESAFNGEIYLKEVILPESIEIIGDGAFANTGITNINIPSKVNYVCASMFAGSPINNYTVSANNQTYKSNNGFIYSKDMSTLVLAPAGKWEANPGYNFTIPSSVTQIGKEAFSNVNIKSITIPGNVKRVRAMAFFNTPIENVTFENGVEMLYDSVFLNCPYLKKVNLPSSLTYIGAKTFGYSYSIDVYGVAQFLSENGIEYSSLNEYNVDYYLSLADASLDMFVYPEADNAFTIYAPQNSAGHKYVQNNNMKFVKSQALIPVLKKVESAMDGVSITWSRSGDAEGYYVYKNTSSGWSKIATINDNSVTSYTDTKATPLTTNTYTVVAFNSSGRSDYNKKGLSCYYVTAPKNLTAKNTVNGVSVNWSASGGNDYFYIYRKTSASDTWKYVDKVAGTKRSYIDTSASAGKRYYYMVKTKSGSNFSAYNKSGVQIVFVSAPTVTKVYNTQNSVAVKWSYSGSADSFMVYRKAANGKWKLLKTVDGSKQIFYDGASVRGTKYTYTVKAVYKDFVSGYYSAGKTIISMESPLNLKIKNKIAGVNISWEKCDGASGYYVYRKTSSGYKKIATINKSTQLNYTDKTAGNGKTYTYTIKAFNGSYVSTYNSTGVKMKFLKAPELLSGVSTKSGVKITYSATAGCDGYYIYRSTANSSYKKIGTVKSGDITSYTDKTAVKGTTYKYTIKAYDGSYVSACYSAGVQVKDKY